MGKKLHKGKDAIWSWYCQICWRCVTGMYEAEARSDGGAHQRKNPGHVVLITRTLKKGEDVPYQERVQ